MLNSVLSLVANMQTHSLASRSIHAALWVVMALFLVISAAAALLLHSQIRSPSDACEKCIVQELRIMLNILAPVSVSAFLGLGYFTSRGLGRPLPVATAGILSAATITGFAIFAGSVFRDLLPGQQLSKIVWWMF